MPLWHGTGVEITMFYDIIKIIVVNSTFRWGCTEVEITM